VSVESVLFDILWDEFVLWSAFVAAITFGWLYHHSFWYRSDEDGELPNRDGIRVGFFPKHNDDIRLEVTWTVLPFLLIVYLTYISWAPLDATWTSTENGNHNAECDYDNPGYDGSNNRIADIETGIIESDCYHIIEITGQQWSWIFDCRDLGPDLCETDFTTAEVYGTVPRLMLKEGETYLAVMESNDVTHAPWFLELATKEDVLPGQQTALWLPITEGGDSIILCAEYCGDAHSVMAGILSVHK
jgi:heme/copper-type cytochrome/quinol oxidase subunit 2